MYYKIAETASKWWVEQMKKKCNQLHPDKVSGFGSNLIVVDVDLAIQLELFQESLQKEIQQHLEKYPILSIGCCYYPNKILAQLARKNNISLSYFPIHAQMDICRNSISVSVNNDYPYKLQLSI